MIKSLGILVVVVCLLASACERKVNAPSHSGEPQRYELKGKVTKIEKEKKHLTVAHEKIQGFMEAMTMDFAVKDEAALEQVQVGDQIQATLIYNPTDNRTWLENLAVVKLH